MNRRQLLGGMSLGAGGLLLGGCDKLTTEPNVRKLLIGAEKLHMHSQRLLASGEAREYRPDQMSPVFRVNGNSRPASAAWEAHALSNFANWRLVVDGLVGRPLQLSLHDLGAFRQRAQITRHDCVEGWSAIGKWQGPLLSDILMAAKLTDRAKYIVFHCADDSGGKAFYESIDLYDAFHPQTIMALLMNDRRLDAGHGAPVRLRAERHLGYKQAKYVMRIEARDRIDNLYGGKGGYWEDSSGYAWYAGI
ncbi:MAG: molybdopterin-dependent oxidoreductase [Sphingomicrobium sp.]